MQLKFKLLITITFLYKSDLTIKTDIGKKWKKGSQRKQVENISFIFYPK